MTDEIRRSAFSICRVFALLCAAACPVSLPAAGQSNDVTAERAALLRVAQFTQDVRKLREVIGPPQAQHWLASACEWCPSELIFCIEEKTAEYTNKRFKLYGILQQAETGAGSFVKSYEPTQAWIEGLPTFSRKFDIAADRILSVQDEISAGKIPSDEKREIIKQALQDLTGDLADSSGQLKKGTQALAVYLERQSSDAASIRQATEEVSQSALQTLERLKGPSRLKECQDMIGANFDKIKELFLRWTQDISIAYQRVQTSIGEAQQGIAVLLGGVVSFQTDLQSVIQGVKAATNDQLGSFLERLHLSAAKKRWQDLASAASSLSKNTNQTDQQLITDLISR